MKLSKKKHKKLGKILLERELITEFQLEEALKEQRRTGMPLGKILIEQNLVEEQEIQKIVNEQEGIFWRVSRFRKFLHTTGLKLHELITPAILSVGSAIFGSLSIGLLIPVLKGIIDKNFSFVKEAPALSAIVKFLPSRLFQSNTNIFIFLMALIAVSAIMQQLLTYLASLSLAIKMEKFSSGLRKVVFNRYITFGKQYFDRESFGHLHTVLLGFTQMVSAKLETIRGLLTLFLRGSLYLVIMFLISWKMTLCVMLIFPVLHFLIAALITKIKKGSKVEAEARTKLSAKAHDTLTCIPLIKLYASEKKESEKFAFQSDLLMHWTISLRKKTMLIGPFQRLVVIAVMLGLVSAVAAMVVRHKTADLSGFLIFFYLLKESIGTFQLSNTFRTSLAVIQGPMHEIVNVLNNRGKYFVRGGKDVCEAFNKEIRFKGLSFSYTDERQILKNVSFSIPKGNMVAIVGPTGSGKTTIANLLLRFYDCPGDAIFIDGKDIRSFTTDSLMRQMALVSQQTLLLNDTLRMNIAYGLENIDDADIMAVVKKAHLDHFIEQLPEGLNTLIGERGVKLSGGERQRVAIARAMLKGAEILILDEATSSLDTRTEKLIQEAIEEAVKGRTTIVIAHRLSTIKNADKVVVIDNGKIIERGLYDDLLERKGRFYQYVQEQKFF